MRYRVMLVDAEEKTRSRNPKADCVAEFEAESDVGAMRIHRRGIREGRYPTDSTIEEAY